MTEQADPLSRGQALIDSMTFNQREKFDAAFNDLKVEWAIAHGKIDDMIMDALRKRAALNTDISAICVGSQPLHSIAEIAEAIGHSEPFLQASLDARDARLKKSFEDAALSELPAHIKMTMQRNGSLEGHIARRVAEQMDARVASRL